MMQAHKVVCMTLAHKLPAQPAAKESSRKKRLTLSLERETVQFLKQRQVEAKAPSLSAYVENIIAERRRELELEELNTQITAYYDAISDAERTENSAWGQLSEREFLSAER
jgi:hypothetical protein